MTELSAIKSYLKVRINALEREQAKHNWNDRVLKELYDIREFVNSFDVDEVKVEDVPSIEDFTKNFEKVLLEVLNEADDHIKKQCNCDKD